MKKVAFKMKLIPGYEAEYKRRHDLIWEELQQELRQSGIFDYTIFLDDETHTLFAVQWLKEGHSSDELPNNPVVKKWWTYMADIMEVNPDNSPVTTPLRTVFHLE